VIEGRGQRAEVRSQRSEVRGQRSEVRGQKSEVRGQKSEVRGQKSEVRSQRCMSFLHRIGVRHKLQQESTAFGERIPINREIEFGMTKVERVRFFPGAPGLRMT